MVFVRCCYSIVLLDPFVYYLPLGRARLSGIPDGSLGPVHQHLAGQVIVEHDPKGCSLESEGPVAGKFVVLVQFLIALKR